MNYDNNPTLEPITPAPTTNHPPASSDVQSRESATFEPNHLSSPQDVTPESNAPLPQAQIKPTVPNIPILPSQIHADQYMRNQFENHRANITYTPTHNQPPPPPSIDPNSLQTSHPNIVYNTHPFASQTSVAPDQQPDVFANANYIMRSPYAHIQPESSQNYQTPSSPLANINRTLTPKNYHVPHHISAAPGSINPNIPQIMLNQNQMIPHAQYVQPRQPMMQMSPVHSNYIDQQQPQSNEGMMFSNQAILRPQTPNVTSGMDKSGEYSQSSVNQNSTAQPPMTFQIKQEPVESSATSNSHMNQQTHNIAVPQAHEMQPNMVPQAAPQSGLNFESLSLPNKISLVINQMNQLQNTINSLTVNPNQPQTVQLYQFLNTRLNSLKAVYVQLMQQQQIQQRSMMMPIQQGGVPPQIINNPQAYAMFQQQQLSYQGHHIPQNSQMSQQVQRANLISNPYHVRMAHQTPGGQMMIPPGLARFPQAIGRGYGIGNQHMMVQQINPRMMHTPEFFRGRKGQKLQRRRKRYSSESEEESEITSSDVDSISQISASATNMEDTELRRSTRRHTTKSYTQEFPDESEEDVSKKDQDSTLTNPQDLIPFQPTEQVDGKIMLVERILADRYRAADESDDASLITEGMVEEYYVKFKFFSYLHCEWCNATELKKRDRNAMGKIKRYKIKKKESPVLFIDDDPFNPDYVEIDRLLDVKTSPDPTNPDQNVTCYLVKWCALPYDESTWEFDDVVDELSIKEFEVRNTFPSQDLVQFKNKPSIYQWQKLNQTPIYKNGNVLRDYQLEGINWLLYEYYCGTNCILADEMGLGKTVQSIAFLIELRKAGIRGPFIIIAPLSTIGNWYREFQNWSDFNVVVFHGTASSRNIIHRYELFYRNENNDIIENVCKFEVLITTYEMILAENDFLKKVNWRIAIVDEAHRLKNRKCKLLENLSTIGIEHRVLLTGTPLQNTLDELLSLMNFLDPDRADALENLMQQNTGKLESNTQVQQIQSFLKPVILRRLKEDVEKNIAPKEETIIEVEMTNIQKKVYRGVLERNLSFLTKGSSTTNLPNLMNIMMELRKCCNHPFLINGVEEKILNEYVGVHADIDRLTAFRKALIESSGKMVLVDKLLPKLKANGHKMLIFSQMVRVLDLIEEYLVSHNFLFERIDGSVRGNLRQAAIDRFSKPDSDRTVFLLCTKAGGLGINLTAADTVIIFDSDWNPQNDIQAQARCHRIGQNKAVKVYRLICRKTYEREMFDRASLKLGLDRAVLQDINAGNATDGGAKHPGVTQNHRPQLTKKEVEELLRKGAYGALMDEDVDETAKFCSEDIDQILERRATVVQIAGEAKGSTFAKASFNANINSEQVDVDDPDFWVKWAKSANIDPSKKAHDFIIEDTPRIRKKIRSLDDNGDDDEVDIGKLINEKHNMRSNLQKHSNLRTSWSKKECVKVEKYLLIYGWGRWNEILQSTNFKSNITHYDIEQISKGIVVICWQICRKSDSSYNDFVEKAIRLVNLKNKQSNEVDSEDYNYRPYTKRTRSKKLKSRKRTGEQSKICLMQVGADWKNSDIDTLVFDLSYKKHLIHSSVKILIRLRMLFQVEYYMLRNCKDEIQNGVHAEEITDLNIYPTSRNNVLFPSWWDNTCDRSVIIGLYKHGYENYEAMRNDPQLCFLKHYTSSDSKNDDTLVIRRRGRKRKAVNSSVLSDEETNENIASQKTCDNGSNVPSQGTNEGLDFPTNGDLNIYLKRMVTAFWKNRVKAGNTVSMVSSTKKESKKPSLLESKEKWTKKEECDFYKTLTCFGIIQNVSSNHSVDWSSFRAYCSFARKSDEMLDNYYNLYIEKCKTIVENQKLSTTPTEIGTTIKLNDPTLNFEKATKVLKRIELFSLIRGSLQVADLNEVLSKAPIDPEFPTWWNTDFDHQLLHAVSLYGLDPIEKRMFYDQDFKFFEVLSHFHKINTSANQNTDCVELASNASTITPVNDLLLEQIKILLHWPKLQSIIKRCYGLSTLALNGTYGDIESDESLPLSSNIIPQTNQPQLSTSSSPTQIQCNPDTKIQNIE